MPPCEGGGAVSGSVFHPRGSVRSEYDKITCGRNTELGAPKIRR
jgi:hypothetical protein